MFNNIIRYFFIRKHTKLNRDFDIFGHVKPQNVTI